MITSDITRIFMVRHGETQWNQLGKYQGVSDSPLTDRGKVQVDRMGSALQAHQISFSALYASPLGRADESAAIIAPYLDMQVRIDERLKERNYGIFEGFTRKEVEQRFPHEVKMNREQPGFVIPKGESREDILRRVKEFLHDMVMLHGGEDVLLVTHGGWISMALRYVLHIPMVIENRHIIDNTHLAMVRHTVGDGWQVERTGSLTIEPR